MPDRSGTMSEANFSDPSGDDFEALSRDRIPVRSMVEADLPAIIAIDRKITGRDRGAYYRRKLAEVLEQSGVRVSLVAEVDGQFAGFVMARLDYGDFGRTLSTGVIDTIGVSPALAGREVGRALLSQLMINLASLRVEKVQTTVAWNQFGLLGFLEKAGFRPAQRLSFRRAVTG
ncbi:MAG: GNAT family N-acetyltransferase [Alphaproteobacteria bacterium]|nr:GNAT family N-acetyltransferase [Alphaproteobacteria bacterium]